MKQRFRIILPAMTLCLILLCGVTLHLIIQIQEYGKLINYVGIVRGATQRLIKLEISGVPSQEIVTYLDDILQELHSGSGSIGLVRVENEVYNRNLSQLTHMWGELKADIRGVRAGDAPKQLLELSEEYFTLANDTVFAAETFSNHQTGRLSGLILVMVGAIGLTWAFLMRVYIKRLRQLEHANEDLAGKVYTDPVTGAPNLEKFRIDAERLIHANSAQKFAVYYVDIDNFKYYNDVFGASYGDEILSKYAEYLREDMGKIDIFCHLSSDNFLVLRSYTDRDKLIARQEAVDQRIAQYALESKEQHLFTLSCGICCAEDMPEVQPIGSLIERANFARKTVKNQPFAHYAFYNESIRNKMLEEKAIENRMHAALEEREFVVFLQPKVALETGRIACAEALVRWITPGNRVVPPDEFIPVFEKNRFISSLDQYVMEEVCAWISQRIKAGLPVIPVSVNVSRMQLYDPDFVKTYAALKARYEIPDRMVEIEFTESIVFENMSMLLRIIAALKREGFLCSLDDFGKGYSSLNMLRNLPVDVLKLDKLFFDEDDQPEKANTIILGVVDMVKRLDMVIVAEGVEQEEQVRFLREIGCDLVQGYVFYRPMPICELELLLSEQFVSSN